MEESASAFEVVMTLAVIPLASSAVGAAFGVFFGIHLSKRPRRVVSLSKDVWVDEGMNLACDWQVAHEPVPDHFENVYQAAWARFGKDRRLSYGEILDWVRAGAPGPDGKRTIHANSTRTKEAASRAALALTKFVFCRGEVKKL